jgi:hypothetical protein
MVVVRRDCSLEDSLGGEPRHSCSSRQALPISTPRERSPLAGAQLSTQGLERARCSRNTPREPVAG